MDISINCPYCGKYTSVERLITRTGTYIGNENITAPTAWYNQKTNQTWWMGKCNSCDGALLILNDAEQIFPTPQPPPTDERIPEIIRTDIVEAKKCFAVSAFNSTVVMARRAIQSICLDKGASKSKKLHQQIDEIRASGIITEDLKNWATEIRFVGNDGAHPGDVVTREDAQSILQLSEQFAHVIYVVPEMANRLKVDRENKKANSKDQNDPTS